MTKRIDIKGEKFGLLSVISHVEDTQWVCRCDCGRLSIVASYDLRNGHTRSCGCLRTELTANRARKHGMSKTPTYKSWLSMRKRCTDKTHEHYKYYGAIGITVCDRWQTSFENFFADMGERPKGKTLDRINSKLGYTPDNCKWSTQKEQMNNTKRSVLFEGKTTQQWADELGLKYATVSYRLRKHGKVLM